MVVDLRAVQSPRLLGPPAPLAASLAPAGQETDRDRAARVRKIAALVKSGAYAVHTRRLAVALLEWDPRRGAPRASAEAADRRRSYMRDYMRRRRAGRLPDPAESLPQVLSSWATLAGTSSS